MADYLISTLIPSVTNPPTYQSDATGTYSLWPLSTEVSFNVYLTNYVPGSNVIVRIRESTPGVSLNHKWRATVLLNGAGSTQYSGEYTSSATPSERTNRSLTISTAGTIGGTAIASGDELNVTMTRVAATSNEDGNSIKLYWFVISYTAEEETVSYTGRVGTAEARVRRMINDAGDVPKITSAQILSFFTMGIEELEECGCFRKTGTINSVSGTNSYSLIGNFADYVAVETVRWTGYTSLMQRRTRQQLIEYDINTYVTQTDAYPYCYFAEENDYLYIYRTPAETTAGAIIVMYRYQPTKPDGIVTTDFPGPATFDQFYVARAIQYAVMRDYKNTEAQGLAAYWKQKADTVKRNIIHQQLGTPTRMRPPR